MVLKLADALEIPLRERNSLLTAAGFAAQYRESALDEPHMAPVKSALKQVLGHHEPFPAVVVDRKWNRVMANGAADTLFALAGTPVYSEEPFNLAAATLAPDGLRRFITNWDVAAPLFVQRLRGEAIASGESEVIAHVEALIRAAGELPTLKASTEPLLPVLPLELALDELKLSLFTVISTFGTPQDITTDELRIEAFYPADERTRRFFQEKASA